MQRLPLFKEKRMMVKLKNICDDRESGDFVFRVFLSKRPEVSPSWNFDDQVLVLQGKALHYIALGKEYIILQHKKLL